ncbi:hypothetical protein ACFSO7_01060 [Bacillus sp. CGMCC 1.16607]|uniref:hypothetical protein n=1 Tax=Bacillus sp. CGMCC 1.16607 TaxID=3351842 RepID=UPI00362A7B19
MKVESVIRLINSLCNDNKLDKARSYINKEWDRITEYKNLMQLNDSAQQFVKIIHEEKENGSSNALTNTDKKVLNLINQYIRDSNFNFAKRIFREHQELIEKSDAQQWLTSDARYICDVWKKSELA